MSVAPGVLAIADDFIAPAIRKYKHTPFGRGASDLGINPYINLTVGLDVFKSGYQRRNAFIEDTWNENPNTFANLAENKGHEYASWGFAAGTAIQMFHGGLDSGTKFYGGRKGITSLAEKGLKGLSKGSSFSKFAKGTNYLGWGVMAGAAAMEFLGSRVMSKAGAILDYGHQHDLNRRRAYYNTAFYEGAEQYKQSAFQQIGSAMGNMHERMFSIARLTHSVG